MSTSNNSTIFSGSDSGSGDDLSDNLFPVPPIGQNLTSLNYSLLPGEVENPVPPFSENSSDRGHSLDASSLDPAINSNPIATTIEANESSRTSASSGVNGPRKSAAVSDLDQMAYLNCISVRRHEGLSNPSSGSGNHSTTHLSEETEFFYSDGEDQLPSYFVPPSTTFSSFGASAL